MNSKLRIADIANKGHGIVATGAIKAGEVLLVDGPLNDPLYLHLDNPLSAWPALVQFTRDMLDPGNADKKLLLDQLYSPTMQHTHFAYKRRKLLSAAQMKCIDAFRMNHINSFLFPVASKLNHKLPSNVALVSLEDDALNRIIVIATDNIRRGEEIGYDYFNLAEIGPSRLRHQLHLHGIRLPRKIRAAARKLHAGRQRDELTESEFKAVRALYANGVNHNNIYAMSSRWRPKDAWIRCWASGVYHRVHLKESKIGFCARSMGKEFVRVSKLRWTESDELT